MTIAGVAERSGVAGQGRAERLAELAAVVAAVVDDDPTQWSDDDLAAGVRAFEVAVRQLTAVQSMVVGEAVRRGLPRGAGCRDGAGWLRSLVNVSAAQARVRADVGQVLLGSDVHGAGVGSDPDLRPARDAVLAGAVTVEHAMVVVEAADRLAPPAVPPDCLGPGVRSQALGFLVERGTRSTVYELKTAAAGLVVELDPDGDARLARDEERQAALRGLTLSRMGTGLVRLAGTLTSECAGLFATAIDGGSAPRPAVDGALDERSAAMRRHDSLNALLRHVVAADGVLPSTHGTPYRLVVTVPEATLRQGIAGAGRVAAVPGTLPDGWPISSTTAATVACTAELVPVSVDPAGNPLDVGDTQYVFPTKIRTAIATRDRHCTWPGCTAPPPWCDTHHLTPFSAGGATSVTNGGLLCGRHHRLVHSRGLVGYVHDGTVHWNAKPPPAPTEATNTIADRLVDHLTSRRLARQRQ